MRDHDKNNRDEWDYYGKENREKLGPNITKDTLKSNFLLCGLFL